MTVSSNVEINFEGLEALKKQLGNNYEVRVGILGDSTQRDDDDSDMTNAEIGVIQEFGSVKNNIPPRSFLRMPLEQRKQGLIDWIKQQDMEGALIEKKELEQTLSRWGVKAEEIIDKAFETSGFGRWAANKASTIAQKKSEKPLINTQQLRRSITSKLVERGKL